MNYPSHKDCRKCKETKPLEEFYISRTGKYGRNPLCAVCEKARVNAWITKAGPKEKRRRKFVHIARKYNLTEAEYVDMLKAQSHKCKLCGMDEVDCKFGTLSVDHCHSTGKIRALLCPACNSGLGHFNDNTELLAKAIEYLKEHSSV